MAHGENAKKYGNKAGKEWWGKRPLNNTSVSRNKGMKFWKRQLHKVERVLGNQNIKKNDCTCEKEGRSVWRISNDGTCLRCGNKYNNIINKNDRVYINNWFNSDQKLKEGDIIDFEMPPFCTGEYSAKIFIDNDGDPFIKKSDDYSEGCRDYELIKKEDYENC